MVTQSRYILREDSPSLEERVLNFLTVVKDNLSTMYSLAKKDEDFRDTATNLELQRYSFKLESFLEKEFRVRDIDRLVQHITSIVFQTWEFNRKEKGMIKSVLKNLEGTSSLGMIGETEGIETLEELVDLLLQLLK